MILVYLNKKNNFITKRFDKREKMNRFIKRKGIVHFYIDGYWVIR